MPAHDWKRVRSGTFHAFHTGWIGELQKALNTGLLPSEYYAQAEQVAGEIIPDVLALHSPSESLDGEGWSPEADSESGGLAVAEAPPKVAIRSEAAEAMLYTTQRKTLVIRHISGDELVAMIEIISPGNKHGPLAVQHFVQKGVAALIQGIHLLILDLFPPGPADPQGLHGELWSQFNDEPFALPPDKRLTLAAYAASALPVAYIEPIAVGQELPEMPLFLTSQRYINVPLEATYRAAYEGVPERWRRVIEDRA